MAEESRKLANNKRIILCADGTWLASDQGDKSTPSNVARLARSVASSGLDDEGNVVKQVVLYQSGLASGDLPLQKAIYGGLGWGLDNDVCQMYEFISNNYESGDELFFFGFSRGAFTVRSVAGLVSNIGVLSAVHMSRFAEMWEAYRANTDRAPFRQSEWYRKNEKELGLKDVRVKVVGVWDTVGALGIPQWPVVGSLTNLGVPINKKYAFHNTIVSKNIDNAFQALAIDEQRLTFTPTLWHKTAEGPTEDLQQCWFPGVHSNVGGQPGDGCDVDEIGMNTFAWMVDNLSGMLTFEDAAIKILIGDYQRVLKTTGATDGWGCGPIVSNFAGLQGTFFRVLGKQLRTPGAYPRAPGEAIDGATNESFHPLTRIRSRKLPDYKPESLQGYEPEQSKGNAEWQWVKKGAQPIPEYVMRPDRLMSVAYEEGEKVKYKVQQSLSRLICPSSILAELDRDNGIVG